MGTPSEQVLTRIEESWAIFKSAVAEVAPERMEVAGVVESWTVKDLLGHVTTWESEMMANVQRLVDGLEMKGYLDTDGFNAETSAAKATLSLGQIQRDLTRVHQETVQFVSGLSDELVTREEAEWRIRIDTFAHYREHAEHIRSWLAGSPAS